MRGVKKAHLPAKTCPACGLPFAWRKKWERDWEHVIYCSERCRRHRLGASQAEATATAAGATVAGGDGNRLPAPRGRTAGRAP